MTVLDTRPLENAPGERSFASSSTGASNTGEVGILWALERTAWRRIMDTVRLVPEKRVEACGCPAVYRAIERARA